MSTPQVKTRSGSLFLFRLFGVNVFVHWTWALVAFYEIDRMKGGSGITGDMPEPLMFYIVEYLCLFAIVLIHEYGHALACKSVGGKAERIILWPLGGLAYVQPPQRAGATLWSIAAGPLVNVVLAPILYVLYRYFAGAPSDNAVLGPVLHTMNQVFGAHHAAVLTHFFHELTVINLVLLVFNLLPIYPLDGGQILRSLLWFIAGRGMSLMIAAVIGVVGAAGLIALALYAQDFWLGLIALFMASQSYRSLRAAKALRQLDKIPRHTDATCPNCGEHPPAVAWRCPCGAEFDPFVSNATCTHCGQHFEMTMCPLCGVASPYSQWHIVSVAPATTPA